MSLDQEIRPTDADGQPAEAVFAERTRIEYFRAYQQAVESPNWVVNLLWGMLAFFSAGVIPIVGPMVWTGYLYECVESLATSRGRLLPDFDANRFGDYLTRGIWPYMIQVVVWIALWAAWFLVYVGMIVVLAIAGSAGDEYAPVVMAVGFPLLALTLATVVLVPLVLLTPVMLRAGLTQDLSAALKLSWWGDFLKRMWLEIVASTLFIVMTGFVLSMLGCLLIGVGSYVAWAWVTLANAHLAWQLYELYLARGGQPVPLVPRKLVPPPYVPAGYGYPPGGASGYQPPGYPPSGHPES